MKRETALRLARWLVAAFAIALLALSIAGVALFPPYAAAHLDSDKLNTPNASWTAAQVQAGLRELGWPATTAAWIGLSRGLVGLVLAYPVLILLLWRGIAGWYGIFVAFVFAQIAGLGGSALQPLVERMPELGMLDKLLGAISWQLFFLMLYFFPNGKPVPGWIRWPAWLWAGWIVFQLALGNRWATDQLYDQIQNSLAYGLVTIALGSQFYRYFRRSNAVERQQIKLVVSVLGLLSVIIALAVPLAFHPPDPARLGADLVQALILWYLFGLTFLLVPLAISISILRYRLWDIDLIIRRTLTYSILTVLLGLVYFGGVTLLQGLVSAVGGQQSPLITVITTLIIAGLFNPLRHQIQNFIDRRFYRQKYNAEQALANFAIAARSETDLDRLSAHLVDTVQTTLQPETTSLWLGASPQNRSRTAP